MVLKKKKKKKKKLFGSETQTSHCHNIMYEDESHCLILAI